MDFSNEQMKRYSRHLILQGVGLEGQKKFAKASVFIVGAGGLGSPVALYLAAAGIGKIGIIDDDVVDLSNLQRQIIHTSVSVGEPKVESAKRAIEALNSDVQVQIFKERLNAANIENLIAPYDFVVDGSDNFGTKFLVNDACVKLGKKLVYAGILRFAGQCMSINPRVSACYACVFDSPPPPESVPSCASAGVLGALAGVLGSIQASEVLKIILNADQPLYNKILSVELLGMNFRTIKVAKNENCRVCSRDDIVIKDYEQRSCWEL